MVLYWANIMKFIRTPIASLGLACALAFVQPDAGATGRRPARRPLLVERPARAKPDLRLHQHGRDPAVCGVCVHQGCQGQAGAAHRGAARLRRQSRRFHAWTRAETCRGGRLYHGCSHGLYFRRKFWQSGHGHGRVWPTWRRVHQCARPGVPIAGNQSTPGAVRTAGPTCPRPANTASRT